MGDKNFLSRLVSCNPMISSITCAIVVLVLSYVSVSSHNPFFFGWRSHSSVDDIDDHQHKMENIQCSVPNDPNSFSRPDEVAVTNLHLNLNVDFSKTILAGDVIVAVERRKSGAKHLILDTSELTIQDVKNHENGEPLEFRLADPDPNFGSKMEITLPSTPSDKFDICITYETSPNATALQWLTPEQTAGKKYPYMFSQCQAIHARSVVPCQDTPSVKAPYTATITAPCELVVLMSAVREGEPTRLSDGVCSHKFEQKVAIPSYLIAIAVGALESRKLGPRSLVWSEKELVDEAAYEFVETEVMLTTAESICGTYVWGVYDLLVMPPSFAYGGMENPCLTFVTPTLLAGDRSLADVVAHEISHSWTGNLITNANFEHFWLNEGFTMFVERKILGKMYGDEARLFSAFRGLKELADEIKTRGENDPMTSLVVNLKNVNPDDAFSVVPYEKGHTLLFHLEELVGGPDNFDPFLKDYLENFKYKSIVTDDFKNYLFEYFPSNNKLRELDWDTWLHKPGMPPYIPEYHTKMGEECTNLTKKWVEWSGDGPSPFSSDDVEKLTSTQVIEFLAQLLLEKPLSVEKLKVMENVYKFNSVKNTEIRFRWLRLGIKSRWSDQIPRALEFVTEQGRMKFIRPIYRDLYEWPEARDRAVATFVTNEPNMMYVSSYTVSKDLHLRS
ncbi:leukotriene A-4 hydrolase [Anabrus simplex]|uniref:leukotriene A-4 hydrolase n=1 Tax=Anabrus simplex TaxID=316456 RepID=UPI0035A2E1A3